MIAQAENTLQLALNYDNIFKFLNSRFGGCYGNLEFYHKIDLWMRLYKGYVKEYHDIVTNNGVQTFTRRSCTMNMAQQVAADWMKCLVADKPVITVSSRNQNTSRFIQGAKGNGGVLNSNNFYNQFTTAVERAFGLGTSALVLGIERITDKTEYKIDINSYTANSIIPIKYKNGFIEECAFLSEFYRDNAKHFNLSCHVRGEDGKYLIYNFEAGADAKFESYLSQGVEPFVTGSEKPLFFIIEPIGSNQVDFNSPMGMSVYSNAVDIVLNCDYFYDALKMDVLTGQRIIMMHKSLLGRDSNGNLVAPQDVKKHFMSYTGDENISDASQLINDFTPKLNTEEICNTIQQNLNILSMRCGLGNQYYHFDKVSGVTATEVLSSNMDLVRSVRVNSEMLTNVITSMIKEAIWLGRNVLGYADLAEDAKIIVTIPDGVVTDDNTEKEQDRQDVAAGIMSKAEYRAKWYGETLEDAEKKIAAMSNGVSTSKTEEKDDETKATNNVKQSDVQDKQETA